MMVMRVVMMRASSVSVRFRNRLSAVCLVSVAGCVCKSVCVGACL